MSPVATSRRADGTHPRLLKRHGLIQNGQVSDLGKISRHGFPSFHLIKRVLSIPTKLELTESTLELTEFKLELTESTLELTESTLELTEFKLELTESTALAF
jgi:hypothetical protein